jgi:hypothetical protein
MTNVFSRKARPFKEQQRSLTNGFFEPRMERFFTNGQRLRRGMSELVLFVFIRTIRGSNDYFDHFLISAISD